MSDLLGFFFSFQRNQLVGTVVNFLILGIGGTAAWHLLSQIRKTKAARAAVARFEQSLDKGDGSAETIELESESKLEAEHLLHRRIRTLSRLQKSGADVEPTALTALAVSTIEQDARFGRWAASSVVLLGLGGTLIGLSVAVLNSQPLLTTAVQQSEATDAVIGMFSGLASAFSTTLMGIFWAIALGLQLGALRKRQNEYMRDLEELSFVRIYPRFRASPSEALVSAARSLAALQQKLDTSVESMTTELRTRGLALLKTIESSFNALVESTEVTGIELRKTTTTSLQEVVREMRERGVGLATTVDKSFQMLTEELREGTGTLALQLTDSHKAMMQMLGVPGADTATLAQNLSILQKGVVALASAAEQMRQMTPSIEEAIARQVDKQTRDVHDAMHSYTKSLSTSVEEQRRAIEEGRTAVEGGIAKLGAVLLEQLASHDTELLKAVAERTEQLTRVIGEQGEAVKPLTAGAEGLRKAVEGLDSRIQHDAVASAAIRKAVDDLTTTVESLKNLIDAASEAPATHSAAQAAAPTSGGPPTQTTVVIPPPPTVTARSAEPSTSAGPMPFGPGMGSAPPAPPRAERPVTSRPFVKAQAESGVMAMLRRLFGR